MTPDEQRIALTKWAHWKEREYVILPNTHVFPIDIINDLNAVHELETRLNDIQWIQYEDTLNEVTKKEKHSWYIGHRWIHATATQRCEALCRTLFPERF